MADLADKEDARMNRGADLHLGANKHVYAQRIPEMPSSQLQQLLVEEAEQLLDFVARVGDLFGELACDQC